jgi:hypothetical protein
MLGWLLAIILTFITMAGADFLFFGGGHWGYCFSMTLFGLFGNILMRAINPNYEAYLVRRYGRNRRPDEPPK